MTDEDLGKLIAEEEIKNITEKITDIDKRIIAMQTELPDSLILKLNAIGLPSHKKRHFISYQKASSFVILFCIITATICIVKPEVVTALRIIIYEMFSVKTNESLDIYQEENIWDRYTPDIPDGFQLTELLNHKNMNRLTYQNNDGGYIKISIYKESVTLSLDNEKYDNYEDVVIKQSQGKQITKNNITNILFHSNQYIIGVESNLPEEDVLNIAVSIDSR